MIKIIEAPLSHSPALLAPSLASPSTQHACILETFFFAIIAPYHEYAEAADIAALGSSRSRTALRLRKESQLLLVIAILFD